MCHKIQRGITFPSGITFQMSNSSTWVWSLISQVWCVSFRPDFRTRTLDKTIRLSSQEGLRMRGHEEKRVIRNQTENKAKRKQGNRN